MIHTLHGAAPQVYQRIAPGTVHLDVNSPPYWQARQYAEGERPVWDGVAGCPLGEEGSAKDYINHLVAIYRGVRKCLHPEGLLIVNVGDLYSGKRNLNTYTGSTRYNDALEARSEAAGKENGYGVPTGSKMMIPERLAIAMIDDGWRVRNIFPWIKPTPPPSGTQSRACSSTEQIIIFAQDNGVPHYWDDYGCRPASPNTKDGRVYMDKDPFLASLDARCAWDHDGPIMQIAGSEETIAQLGMEAVNAAPLAIIAQASKGRHGHVARFPAGLIAPLLDLAAPLHGVCGACRSPFRRVSRGEWRGKDYIRVTEGWRPKCGCGAPAVPGLIMDTFGGTGTTVETGQSKGLDGIYIDASREYYDATTERLRDAGMPVIEGFPVRRNPPMIPPMKSLRDYLK